MYTYADAMALAMTIAAADLAAGRYWWRARPGGGAILRYLPPDGVPIDWTAEPEDDQLTTLVIADIDPPEDWAPLPVGPVPLAVADHVCWSDQYRRAASELLARGWTVEDGVTVRVYDPHGDAVTLAALRAAADAVDGYY